MKNVGSRGLRRDEAVRKSMRDADISLDMGACESWLRRRSQQVYQRSGRAASRVIGISLVHVRSVSSEVDYERLDAVLVVISSKLSSSLKSKPEHS